MVDSPAMSVGGMATGGRCRRGWAIRCSKRSAARRPSTGSVKHGGGQRKSQERRVVVDHGKGEILGDAESVEGGSAHDCAGFVGAVAGNRSGSVATMKQGAGDCSAV